MYIYAKRAGDICVAIISIFVLMIPGIIIAVIVKLDSKGPVLFAQERVGKDKKIFKILKFRSMRVDAPKNCPPNKLNDAESFITRSGRILRKTSLDELPQFINVLLGDMSLIGPRPGAAKNEDELIVEREKFDVYSVRPGISGWAQVNGRDALAHNVALKSQYDGEYVEKLSFRMDMRCIYKTFISVISKDGYEEGARVPGSELLPQAAPAAMSFYAQAESTAKVANRPVRRRRTGTWTE